MINKIIRTVGHLYCTFALYVASLLIKLIEFLIRSLVSIVKSLTGIEEKKPKVGRKKIKAKIKTYNFLLVSRPGSRPTVQNHPTLRHISWMSSPCLTVQTFLSNLKTSQKSARLVELNLIQKKLTINKLSSLKKNSRFVKNLKEETMYIF